ncbi:Hypothetical protein CINCED_3A005964 [Cinara cedri]|uniref:Uncharacterized protein n=1 Tax=Cinara cedri TaxID=506608 RepID=A0A5E4N6D1_9HEMI|nr:Hypothetical protein CINCED_3A005964 [Cinara cedri]
MAQLEIKNQQKISYIDKLVEHLYTHDSDPPTLRIEKEDDDLIVEVEWHMLPVGQEEEFNWVKQRYLLSYKVEGLKDLIGSFLDDYTTTNLDAKLSDYTKTDGSNMTDDISNKLMSHHTAQVFDFFSNLETEYNAMNG